MSSSVPYWRLSNFYFFYFASLGALIPFWGPYLKSLGFNESKIGELMAIIMATKIVAPYVWGWIADHTGHRMSIVRLASLLGAVTFVGVLYVDSFWWLALIMTVFSFFWNASLPQFEATTMNHLGDNPMRYNGIRLWGSVGFIVAVVALGVLFDYRDLSLLPGIVLALFIGIWLASLFVPEQAAGHLHITHEPLRKVLAKPEVASLLLICFLAQASHGPYYVFYTRYLETLGYQHHLIGLLWALGVLAEIVLFFYMARIYPKLGSRRLLLIALSLTTVRWLGLGLLPGSVTVLLVVQLLHAASFGIVHAVAIHMIHKHFTGANQGRGQALYSSVSFGAGGAIGSLTSGYLWVGVSPASIFLVAAGSAFLAFVIAWRHIHSH